MLIIDSHCHAWAYWPYQPPVPDPEHRGRIEQLLYEMDLQGVARAMVVCAQVEHNLQNNQYVAEQVAKYPDRLHQLVDLDSFWSATYRQSGSADRLRRMADRWPIVGFTHYVANNDDGAWLHSPEGLAVFAVAAERELVASIHCQPHQQPAIRAIAERFPSVPVLCHHMGHLRADEASPYAGLEQVLASAALPNVHIKLSGFAYSSAVEWDYPYPDTHHVVRALYERYGPCRLCWGSDYPVVRFYMTYRHALEALRTHCDFICDEDKELILGRNLERLLTAKGEARFVH